MSLFAGLGESRNEPDVVRPDFKSGRRRLTVLFSSFYRAIAGMRQKTLTQHHRPRAQRAFTPLVPGKKVAVEIERVQINGDVPDGLCAVDNDQTLPCPGQRSHFMDREDTPVNVRYVAHDDGFDAGLVESFFQRIQKRLKGRRPDRMYVDVFLFERVKLARDGRVFVRGGENGITRLPFQRREREIVRGGRVRGERDARVITHVQQGADLLPALANLSEIPLDAGVRIQIAFEFGQRPLNFRFSLCKRRAQGCIIQIGHGNQSAGRLLSQGETVQVGRIGIPGNGAESRLGQQGFHVGPRIFRADFREDFFPFFEAKG